MKVRDQIGHGLWFDLEAGHRGGVAADDLMNKFGVIPPIGHTGQFWSHQPLTGQAMAAGTIDSKELSTVIPSTLELTDLPRALAVSIAPESRLIQDLWTDRVLFPTPGHRALRCGPRGGFRL